MGSVVWGLVIAIAGVACVVTSLASRGRVPELVQNLGILLVLIGLFVLWAAAGATGG